MRLFIAIELSDNMKKGLVGVMHQLKQKGVGGSYVPAQNLHMTLAFLGELESPEEAKAAMDAVALDAFRLSFDEVGYFQDLMWIGMKGNQKVKKYVSDLRKELRLRQVPCDNQKFTPHVTILRQMKGARPKDLTIPKEEMTVTKVSLMRSDIKNGKRVYKELYAVKK